MAESQTTKLNNAVEAGAEVTIKHLQDTFAYDFNLKHPREAYIAGANEYLSRMQYSNLQDSISRDEFEAALRRVLCLNSVNDHIYNQVKYDFLLTSLSDDITLYDAYWANLTNTDPAATLTILSTEAKIFETRAALARYRAKLRVAESDLVAQVDACIKWYNMHLVAGEIPVTSDDEEDVGADKRVWATDDDEGDEEEVDPVANSNRVVEVGNRWERRADGRWWCTVCFQKSYPYSSSVYRHLRDKH